MPEGLRPIQRAQRPINSNDAWDRSQRERANVGPTGDTVTIYKLGDAAPTIHESVFVADSANIIGNVTLGANASVWFGATLRGDNEPITIGTGSNVQENAVLHTDPAFRSPSSRTSRSATRSCCTAARSRKAR